MPYAELIGDREAMSHSASSNARRSACDGILEVPVEDALGALADGPAGPAAQDATSGGADYSSMPMEVRPAD